VDAVVDGLDASVNDQVVVVDGESHEVELGAYLGRVPVKTFDGKISVAAVFDRHETPNGHIRPSTTGSD
jgi:hypothetical protein